MVGFLLFFSPSISSSHILYFPRFRVDGRLQMGVSYQMNGDPKWESLFTRQKTSICLQSLTWETLDGSEMDTPISLQLALLSPSQQISLLVSPFPMHFVSLMICFIRGVGDIQLLKTVVTLIMSHKWWPSSFSVPPSV